MQLDARGFGPSERAFELIVDPCAAGAQQGPRGTSCVVNGPRGRAPGGKSAMEEKAMLLSPAALSVVCRRDNQV